MDPSTEPSPQAGSASLKRPAVPRRGLYPRKRALLACQVCRKKKTKCDNVRPSCGACTALQTPCDYGEFSPDHSSYDPASLELLEQVGQVKQLLEAQQEQLQLVLSGAATRQAHDFSQPLSTPFHHGENSAGRSHEHRIERPRGLDHHHGVTDEALLLSKSLEFDVSTSSSEYLLEWPIFADKYNRLEIESLMFRTDVPYESSLTSTHKTYSRSGGGVNDQDALELIERFLDNVHIKNPIFNIDDVRAKAKHVMEHGFDWDAQSCFVLIACALGCISSSFKSDHITPELLSSNGINNSMDDVPNYCTARSYYVAARKRFGLLEHSILAAQCHFLSGVFEAYCLKPLRAWTSFKEACVSLQICLKTKDAQGHNVNDRFERRLYWSCLKSECELRVEMDLPASGLAKVDFSEQFPLPPSIHESPHSTTSPFSPESTVQASSELDGRLEQSWIYFLSDISHRRISTRVGNLFYQDGPDKWMSTPVDRMIRVAQELHLQLTQWYNHVPYMHTTAPSPGLEYIPEELVYVTRLRYVALSERINRPFLYLAVHLPASDPVRQLILPYAEQCLDVCLEVARVGVPRHRHHGTWSVCRNVFSACVQIIAAVESRQIPVSNDWSEAVGLCIVGIKFWEGEAQDLRKMREMLEHMLANAQAGVH